MFLFKRLLNFIKHLFSRARNNLDSSRMLPDPELVKPEEKYEDLVVIDEVPKIDISERTIASRLYMIEQSITAFKELFPAKYDEFLVKISYFKADYEEAVANSEQSLTFAVDPDLSYNKRGEVLKLEHDIQVFFEKDVKYALVLKRLQRLILKLNILFNVSIWYSKETDQEKGLNQIKRAQEAESKIIKDFKQNNVLVNDIRLREEVICLIAYLDYLIFKVSVRYSDEMVSDLLNNSLIVKEFIGFEYVPMFKAFVKDELYGMGVYVEQITEESYRNAIKCNQDSLMSYIFYSTEEDTVMLSREFWENVFDFESEVLNYLRNQGISKDKLSVKISSRINVQSDEKEVINLPKVNAVLALTSTYYKTYDTRLLILNMILKNISESITYKEIYFLFVLFGVLEMVKSYPNDIVTYLNKYAAKYPYNASTIEKRKEQVMSMPNKTYVYLFDMEQYEERILDTMRRLNFDFKVDGNKVLINSFYFNGLDNISRSLNNNTSI